MKTHEILAVVMLVLVAGWIAFMASASTASASRAGTGGWNAQTVASPPIVAAGANANPQANAAPAAIANPGSAPQTVTIQVRGNGARYAPDTIRVTQGQHVRLDFDPATLPGCEAQVIIWGLNQQITVSPSNHVLEFDANAPGTYRMSCGMGMINGAFIVDAANGAGANTANTAPAAAANPAQLQGAVDPTTLPGPKGGSCGAGGSCGCGCGGGAR
ncbi:Cupredoxin-like domain protein [uncultured archaeon]|nr:Cupredoxin-like domain protein [uncultured archaeon]